MPRGKHGGDMSDHLQELPDGLGPTPADMERWRIAFDKAKGADGFELVGFRQVQTGEIMGIIAQTAQPDA